jgi:hypothetical protein
MRTIEIQSHEREIDAGQNRRLEGTEDIATREVSRNIENTVREYLAQGDYREGGEERIVSVNVDGEYYGSYTAPQIRRFQAARRNRKVTA